MLARPYAHTLTCIFEQQNVYKIAEYSTVKNAGCEACDFSSRYALLIVFVVS